MLDVAIKYEDELKEKFINTWFKDKYKWWNSDTYYQVPEFSKDTWNKHEFVSLDSSGEIIGYISYGIVRQSNHVNHLSILNFSDNKITFGLDLHRALRDIFEKFQFRKITFNVVIGNPIEKTYDKLIKKYGGRICGYYVDDVKLADGQYYDFKAYEILSTEYFKNIKRRKNDG